MLWVVELSSGSSERAGVPKQFLVFTDVVRCKDVESFNDFVNQFLRERELFGEARRRMYWALFYAWKGS
jgi:hypothetical protein